MKKSIIFLFLINLLNQYNTIAQSTQTGLGFLGHAPGFGGVAIRYVGWDASLAANAIPLSIEHRGTNKINFFTGITQRMTILGTSAGPTAGFIGIGTNFTTPNNLLDVSGGDIDINTATRSYMINDRSVLWHKGGATNIFLGVGAGNGHGNNLNSRNTYLGARSGFSGIGGAGNDQNVMVGFEAGFSNSGAHATYVGYQAGFSHANSNTANTFIGYQSGFNTLGGSNDNTMVGFGSGFGNTGGDQNVFVGNNSGAANTNGSYNSFFGALSGNVNGIFNFNTCLGANSGGVAKGNENTFVGYQSGALGIGNYNVAIGSQVMQAAVSGTENVVIGYKANSLSLGTSFNTIIGGESALANTTGANNTFVGYQSALVQTTGTNNAYFGIQTGLNILNGSGNTFLGARADATNPNSNLTNAAAIGSGARVTFSDHMILGNNGVNVGIGLSGDLTGPQNKLEINRTSGISSLSGLRLRDLAGAAPLPTNNQVLSVNPANGDVILTGLPTPGVLGNICGAGTNPLASSWEIPLNGFNFRFDGNGAGTGVNNVGIGTTCAPLAKLHVLQSSGSTNGSTGIFVENTDQSICFSPQPLIGIKSLVSNPNLNSVKCAGWFESVAAPNCSGSLFNYAIIVPQNGGMVHIGYNPVSTTNFGTYLLDVNGSINCASLNQFSDLSLKNSITTLPNSLNKIKSLRPVTFKWNSTHDSAMAGIHAGFIAQEMDTIISQVVHTDAGGIKSISYTELIPYIVSAMQAQQQQIHHQDSLIQVLTNNLNSCCSNNSSSSARSGGNNGNATPNANQLNIELSDKDYIVLDQNTPNPFAEQTTIAYNIPAKYGFAQLIFKTVDGKIIKTIDITKKGRGQVNVFASDLSNGLYMYTLIVDGNIIDSKKMVKQD